MEMKWLLLLFDHPDLCLPPFLGLASTFLALLMLVIMNGMGISECPKVRRSCIILPETGRVFLPGRGDLEMALGPLFITYAIAFGRPIRDPILSHLGNPYAQYFASVLKRVDPSMNSRKGRIHRKRRKALHQ